MDKDAIDEKVRKAAEVLNLNDYLERKPAQLSGDSVSVWLSEERLFVNPLPFYLMSPSPI